MYSDDEPLDTFPIDLQSTRPFMFKIKGLGEVPYDLAVILIMGFAIGAVNFFWRGALPFVLLWFVIARLVALDYHFITRTKLWQKYTMPSLDGHIWGGVSTTPLPTTTKETRGMFTDAV